MDANYFENNLEKLATCVPLFIVGNLQTNQVLKSLPNTYRHIVLKVQENNTTMRRPAALMQYVSTTGSLLEQTAQRHSHFKNDSTHQL